MRKPRFLLWLIILLTLLSIFIDLPKEILVNKQRIQLPTLSPNITLGPIRVSRNFEFKKGLDLAGGTSIVLRADMKDIEESQRMAAIDSARVVIERRVNFFGVSEPVVQTATVNKDYRVVVELPGITDLNQAIGLIGKTAQLSFWEGVSTESAKTTSNVASPSAIPLGMEILFPNPSKTNLTGSDLKQTSVTFDPNTGNPQVQLVFTQEGAKKFAEITKRNVGKIVSIVLDKDIIEAPQVREPILDGNAVITGSFTTNQAKSLSIQLNAGALPVPLSILEQRTIGATLGEKSLSRSLFAGALGFLIIVIFMSVLYGRLGIIASVALVIYTLFVLAIFKIIPVTLTLAGIAGFILSIGMAVDANILIFERLKEELRFGRKLEVAIELGFSRAWTSIRDSNVSSLITSGILYYFGTGTVRGFALTLAIGVLVSMFSAIVVTRTFLRLVYR